jgi:hypothetical protein
MIIETVILFLLFTVFNAAYHGTLWKKGHYLNSSVKITWTGIRLIVFSINSLLYLHLDSSPLTVSERSLEILPLLWVQFASFWILFDILVNLFSGDRAGPVWWKRIFHLGTSSFSDYFFWNLARFIARIPGFKQWYQSRFEGIGLIAVPLQYLAKIIVLAIGIYLQNNLELWKTIPTFY